MLNTRSLIQPQEILYIFNMIALKETTLWSDDTPNHTYLFENKKSIKCIGYILEGTDKPIMFMVPMSFDRKKRTFKEIKL